MKTVIWILVNTNSKTEADKIGKTILAERLCACYSSYKKFGSTYFWPPLSSKLETNKGPLLVLETLEKNYKRIVKRVKNLHSDQVPFIGFVKVKGVDNDFYNWMNQEIKK